MVKEIPFTMSNLSSTIPPLPIETAVGPLVIIFVSVMYSIVTVTGLLFNSVIILTIAKSKHLHTAMNSHLLGLAISDLLVSLVVIPCRLVLYTGAYNPSTREVRCKFDVFMKTACDCIEFSMLVGMSYERYMSVSKPFDKQNRNRRTIVTVLLSWICSCGIGIMTCIKFGDSVTIYPCYREYSIYSKVPLRKFSEAFLTLPLCVLCLGFIVLYYYLMIQTLKQHNTKLRKSAKVEPLIDTIKKDEALLKIETGSPDLTTNITKLTRLSPDAGGVKKASIPNQSTSNELHPNFVSKRRQSGSPSKFRNKNMEHNDEQQLKPDNSTQWVNHLSDNEQEPVKVHVFTRPVIIRTNSVTKLVENKTWKRVIRENKLGKTTDRKSTKNSENVQVTIKGGINVSHSESNIVQEENNAKLSGETTMVKAKTFPYLSKTGDSTQTHRQIITHISTLPVQPGTSNQVSPTKPSSNNSGTITINSQDNVHQITDHQSSCETANPSCLCSVDRKMNDKLTRTPNSSQQQNISGDTMLCYEGTQISQTSSSDSSNEELLKKVSSKNTTHGTLGDNRSQSDNNKKYQNKVVFEENETVSEAKDMVNGLKETCAENGKESIKTACETNNFDLLNQHTNETTSHQTSFQHMTVPDITSKVDVVEMDGTVHKNVKVEGAVVGAVCVMNKSNRLQGRRRVEMRAAKRIAILIGSFVVLWLPLPLTTLYMSSEQQTLPSDLETLLVTGSISAFTGAFNPIFNLLLNKQLRSASIRVLKGGIKTCTRFA